MSEAHDFDKTTPNCYINRGEARFELLLMQQLGVHSKKIYGLGDYMAFPTAQEIQGMTPMMRQYYELKSQVKDSILFFRMGDFYEVFGDDADEIAPVLQIVLTSRERGDKERIPFCGVPHHSVKAYWLKLLNAGYKVSIADQVEDPSEAKGLVKREIVKMMTPGCVDVLEGLDENSPNYLMAGYENPEGKSWSVAVADISTGELRAGVTKNLEDFYQTVKSFKPKELLIRKFCKDQVSKDLSSFADQESLLVGLLPESPLRDAGEQDKILMEVFGKDYESLFESKSLGISEVVSALLVHFKKLLASLEVFKTIQPLEDPDTMMLSEVVIRDLELFETTRRREAKGSLFHQINKSLSPMGARLMRWSLARPLLSEKEIQKRHQAVKKILELGEEVILDLRDNLKGTPDLERLATRIVSGKVSPAELAKTRDALRKAKWIIDFLAENNKDLADDALISPFLSDIRSYQEPLHFVEQCLLEEPGNLGFGDQVFAAGFDTSLDEKVELSKNGEEKLAAYEQKMREATEITNLKVKRHKTFGLLIEVTKSNLNKIDDRFVRRQTMVNCERFVTAELKELDEELSSAADLAVLREQELYMEFTKKFAGYYKQIFDVSKGLAMIDMLQSFAWLALKDDYCMPKISNTSSVELKACRHPVVERFVGSHQYVPNDVKIDKNAKHILITGPNMAGKSTVMRQTAVAAILAQAGCFVPAKSAMLPVFDKIFSRVGASDNLSQGQSTFMVEMTEAATILRQSTTKSLVILDEVGRGTSTQDGLAIASAILENLATEINCWSMFATHYHELVALSSKFTNITNMTTEVIEQQGGIEFTHRLIPGASANSFGIEVAKLAGIPEQVILRAQSNLAEHEQQLESMVHDEAKPLAMPVVESHPTVGVVSMDAHKVDPTMDLVKQKLEELNINRMTPLQALNWLHDLKATVELSSGFGVFKEKDVNKNTPLFDS